MIKITVELISARDGHREELASGIIFNDATGTPTQGNYTYRFGKKGTSFSDLHHGSGAWKAGKVFKFPRQQKHVWYLIHEALRDSIEKRKEIADETVPNDSQH